MFQRILVPLDGSATASMALPHALELARKFESSLHLVRAVHTLGQLAEVATPSVVAQAAMSQDVVSRLDSAGEQAEARTYLDRVKQEFAGVGLQVETRVRAGAPAEQILEGARVSRAELIVMTAYGAGGAHTRKGGAVFGGVADEVLRQSRVPVLLIRP